MIDPQTNLELNNQKRRLKDRGGRRKSKSTTETESAWYTPTNTATKRPSLTRDGVTRRIEYTRLKV